MKKYKVNLEFPHTTISSFIEQVRNFMFTVYNFQTINISTFQKEIQYLMQIKDHKDVDIGIRIPYMLLSPALLEPMIQTDGIWKSSETFPYLTTYFYEPIIDQNDSKIYINTRRFNGSIEFRIFADSMMELHDIYIAMYDKLYGLNRRIYLNHIKMAIIIPDTITLMYEDGNQIINWANTNYSDKLIPSIDKTFGVVVVENPPILWLENITDASNYFGGTGLPEFALSGMFRFELEIPTYMVILTKALLKSISCPIHTKLVQVGDEAEAGVLALEKDDSLYIVKPSITEVFDNYTIDGCIVTIKVDSIDLCNDLFAVFVDGKQIKDDKYEVVNCNEIKLDFCKIFDRLPTDKLIIEVVKYKEARCPSWLKTQTG